MKNQKIVLCNSHSNSHLRECRSRDNLGFNKKISYHDAKLRNGNWNRGKITLNLNHVCCVMKKIIIFGCGHIGLKLAKWYLFGTNVIGFNNEMIH